MYLELIENNHYSKNMCIIAFFFLLQHIASSDLKQQNK